MNVKEKVSEISVFAGKMVSFNNSLKLHHWHVSGVGSYAQHIALDEALGPLQDITDRIVETSYALVGSLHIVVPETENPENIVKHAENFYKYVEESRSLFSELFTQSVIDDYQETIQQLLYRLKRLE